MELWFNINSIITVILFSVIVFVACTDTLQYQIRTGKYQYLTVGVLLSCVGAIVSWVFLGGGYLISLF